MAKLACGLFVVWHVLFIVVSNAFPIMGSNLEESEHYEWVEPIHKTIYPATKAYERLLELDQGWIMFASPVARTVSYASLRVVLEDRMRIELRSTNEPPDKRSFFRLGDYRIRRIEDKLIAKGGINRTLRGLMERYVAYKLAAWRDHSAGLPKVAKIELWRRTFDLPEPGESVSNEATLSLVAEFDADGSFKR